jgi:hypothetical protein
MRRVLSLVTIVGLVLVSAAPVLAHHAFAAEFDRDKPINFTGTIAGMDWVNPHAWIHIAVKKADGTTEKWMISASTPNSLYRRGLSSASLAVGTEVKVTGFAAKDGGRRAAGSRIELPGGKGFFLSGSGEGQPDDPAPAR